MNSSKNKQDYELFLSNTDTSSLPIQHHNNLKEKISQKLNPSLSKIILKLSGIHFVVALLSLGFCPQFHMSLFGFKAFYLFIHDTFGHEMCSLLCGIIFLGSGALVSAFVINFDEKRVLGKQLILFYFAATLISLVGFYLFGAVFISELYIAWSLGAIIGSLLIFKLAFLKKESLLSFLKIS